MRRLMGWSIPLAGAMLLACGTVTAAQEPASAPADSLLEIGFGGSRRAFVRMEEGAATRVVVANRSGQTMAQVSAQVTVQGRSAAFDLGHLAPGVEKSLSIEVDTRLRPDDYGLVATASGLLGVEAVEATASRSLAIVPRPLERMPVVMWGGGDVTTLSDIGFTHRLVWLADYGRVWEAGRPTTGFPAEQVAERGELLDELLVHGLGAAAYLFPGRWVMRNDSLAALYDRVDRAGQGRGHDNVCASFPQIQAFAYNVGASVAQTYGDRPGLQASLIHSEIRDATDLCFHEHDSAAYRALAGCGIPREAVGKGGVRYSSIRGFPADRVVPDDHPLLTYYRWFWKNGDGWNPLHTQVDRGLKSTGRDDLWTFFDPAVRVPSVWGSGGGVDIVSQWTYSYPDPIKIGQATDELFAMADGADGDQQVMKMTQVIWYRSQTAPDLPEDEEARAQWELDIPDARFITISPDHAREAFWSKLSRPIRGIMYHGWGSLVPAEHGSYRHTNPQTRQVLTELVHDVVRPLGPALLQVPDGPSEVAVLESFASQAFASRGTSGWSGSWEADMHLILQWAQLQPRILYDETVVRDGLDGYEVLVMPSCDVLTEAVAAEVARFQERGGLIVADEYLAPRIVPDILVESRRRTGQADADKAALMDKARALRQELDPFYARYSESSNPEVVVRCRRYGDSDYVFAVNDQRTYGTYVGHHGKVMEQGLPSAAQVSVRRQAAVAYDLVAHQPVPLRPSGEGVAFDIELGPGGGAVYLIADRAIDGVSLTVPGEARLGESVAIEAVAADRTGRAVDAAVPMRLDVVDPTGREAEGSGWYGARDGVLAVSLDLATNDRPGQWTVRVQELASGLVSERMIEVGP